MRTPFKLYRKDDILFIYHQQELIDILSLQIASEIDSEIMLRLTSIDLVSMPPTASLPMPSGQLFYLDFVGSIEHIDVDICITLPISYRESFKLKRKKR